MAILADRSPRSSVSTLVTTLDAARLLQLTRHGVRHLANTGELAGERTLSGQWMFRYGVVMQLVERRAATRVRRRGAQLAAVHVRMLKAGAAGEARQMTLDFGARLKLVGARGKGRKVA